MLADIQHQLESLYGVEAGLDVDDYLISDREVLEVLEDPQESRDVNEKLLVRQNEDHLELSLFIDASVLDELDSHDPRICLDEHNLGAYWTVVEGVSHFLYVVVNATDEHPITLLELELQAEVDKFVTSWFMHEEPREGRLHARLFEETEFDSALDAHGLERYQRANRYAGKYCHQLSPLLSREERHEHALSDLRVFYRLPQAGKIRHIDHGA